MPWLKSGINKIIPSVTYQPIPQIPGTLKLLPEDAIIVDVGAGGRRISDVSICIDFVEVSNTDIVADIHKLPMKKGSVECVFCTGVLEHVVEPALGLKELSRILKTGGIIHLEVPFVQPYHKDPEDYWRWTLHGLRLFASNHGFIEIRAGALIGPSSAINSLIIAYLQSWFSNRYIRKGIDFLLSYLLFPFKFLDAFILNKNEDVLSAVYYVGRKQI